jgi:hypothetical protein
MEGPSPQFRKETGTSEGLLSILRSMRHWIKESGVLPFTRAQMSRLLTACDQYPDNYGRTGQRNALRLRAMAPGCFAIPVCGSATRSNSPKQKSNRTNIFFGASRKQANRFLFLFLCS